MHLSRRCAAGLRGIHAGFGSRPGSKGFLRERRRPPLDCANLPLHRGVGSGHRHRRESLCLSHGRGSAEPGEGGGHPARPVSPGKRRSVGDFRRGKSRRRHPLRRQRRVGPGLRRGPVCPLRWHDAHRHARGRGDSDDHFQCGGFRRHRQRRLGGSRRGGQCPAHGRKSLGRAGGPGHRK